MNYLMKTKTWMATWGKSDFLLETDVSEWDFSLSLLQLLQREGLENGSFEDGGLHIPQRRIGKPGGGAKWSEGSSLVLLFFVSILCDAADIQPTLSLLDIQSSKIFQLP